MASYNIGIWTPWGMADSKTEYVPNIVFYGTPSHGGFHITGGLNKKIPKPFRNVGGWYEEDAAGNFVMYFLNDEFLKTPQWVFEQSHSNISLNEWVNKCKENAIESIKKWFPAESAFYFNMPELLENLEDWKKETALKTYNELKNPSKSPKSPVLEIGKEIVFNEPLKYGGHKITGGILRRYKKTSFAFYNEEVGLCHLPSKKELMRVGYQIV